METDIIIYLSQIKMGLPLASRLRRLAVLIWKNTVLVRTRHWIIALLEILVPLALFSLMASIRANSADFGSVVVKDYKYYIPHNQLEFNNKLRDKVIHYAPSNNFTKMLMSRVYNFSTPYTLNEGTQIWLLSIFQY
jgi:cytochrome b subunit of formate dehydrogenase